MRIELAASQNALSVDLKQSQAVVRAGQVVNRAKSEAQQAPSTVRGKYQDAYVQATRAASSAESSRLQQRSNAVKQLSAQMSRAVSQSARDLTTVISTLITQPVHGNQSLPIGQFLDRYA